MLDWIRIEETEEKSARETFFFFPSWQNSQREAPCHIHSGLNNYQKSENPVDS